MGSRKYRTSQSSTGQHNRRGRGKQAHYVRWCEVHKKKAYTRDCAKAAIRELKSPGMREFPCDVLPNLWHIGHLPKEVRKGVRSIAEYKRRQAIKQAKRWWGETEGTVPAVAPGTA